MTDTSNLIPLVDALDRILTSKALNEGPDAQCTFRPDVERTGKAEPMRVDALRARMFSESRTERTRPVRIERTVKNWRILADGVPFVVAHPWDDSPNVARLGIGLTLPDRATYEAFLGRLVSAANEAERLRLFGYAETLWQMVLVFNREKGWPTANAESEFRRLQAICEKLKLRAT